MAARRQKDAFTINGTDHPTRDGTGIRDDIHVWDLAQAKVAAVERFAPVLRQDGVSSRVINLGAGDGVTVRELVTAFEKVNGKTVPVTEGSPRRGDAVGAFANDDKAVTCSDGALRSRWRKAFPLPSLERASTQVLGDE